ncbi:acetylcholinesterase-like isoform X3 [Dermacentor albipictus]|uniref:acetylcholinesterase-like isoform X3 n=1 Tax=Dermacentor albipictus TaxID=60249 RepID=UPI0031FDE111
MSSRPSISLSYAVSIERVRSRKFWSRERRTNFSCFLHADMVAALVMGGVASTGLAHLLLTAPPYGGPSVDSGATDSAIEVVDGVQVRRTLGIPYAVPLKAQYRFGAPRLLDYEQYLHRHVGTAMWLGGGFTRLGCPQTNSEDDCLYLNVWQPLLEEEEDGGNAGCGICGRPPLLPAVVVLHGGRFQYGGGGGPYTFYDGKYLAAAWRAVVVVPGYRVGAFGFLNAALQPDEAPGNVGIRDQMVALQWVHDNIHRFGASPFQVTLLGHEAGAASVGYHLLSNRSTVYFQRAVMMAGSPYAPYPDNSGSAAERNVRALARELRCPDASAGRAAVDCLRSRSVRATLEAADGAGIEFGPSFLSPQTVMHEHQLVENAVVPEKPPNMRARFRPLDFIAGYTSNEGAPYVVEMLRRSRLHFSDETSGRDVLGPLVDWLRRHGVPEPHKVLDFYRLHAQKFAAARGVSVLASLGELLGDMHVYCPVNFMVEEAAALGSRVFTYEFTHLPYYRWWTRWKGVPQLLDLIYASGLVRAIQDEYGLDHRELRFSQYMANMFAGFVWNGEPPPATNWTRWETFHRGPLVFAGSENSSYTKAASMPHETNCAFWRTFLHPQVTSAATTMRI